MAARRPAQNQAPATIPPSVPPTTGIALLQKLIEKAAVLRDKPDLQTSDEQAWVNLARDYLTRTFGSNSPNVNSVLHASGDGGLHIGMEDYEFREYQCSGISNKIKILESCIEQLETDIQLQAEANTSSGVQEQQAPIPRNAKVFIVHGHDHGTKESVARFLEKLDLEPIILHEKANAGRTVIEKFSDYSDVQFAVVLLTGDDEGKPRGSTSDPLPRARQNVILELGYFLGKLGRSRVCALYQAGVEVPSDYQGVLFVELDRSERWRFDLVRELRVAGFNVDANRIFSSD